MILKTIFLKKIITRNALMCVENREMLKEIANNLNLQIPIVTLDDNIGKNCTFYACNVRKYSMVRLITYD